LHYLIEPWLPAATTHLLAGRSAAGKTHLLFQLLHKFRDQLQPTLYLAADQNSEPFSQLFDKLKIKDRWPIYSYIDEGSRLAAREIAGKVRQIQDAYLWASDHLDCYKNEHKQPPKTLILDPGQTFIPVDDLNSARKITSGFAGLNRLAWKEQITILLIWHTTKSKQDSPFVDTFDTISGSHSIQANTSTKAYLHSPSIDSVDKSIWLYLRGKMFADAKVGLERDDLGLFSLVEATKDESFLYLIPVDSTITTGKLKEIAGLPIRTTERKLQQLEDEGRIQRVGRGCWQRSRPS